MEFLNVDFAHSQVFWTAVSFGLLLALMWWKVVPVVTAVLDERAERIRNDLDNAEKLKTEAEKALADYQSQIKNAAEEAAAIVAQARTDAENMASKRTAELEADLKRKADDAAARIETAKQAAVDELKAQVAEMTLLAAEKVIGAEVDAKKAEKYTDEVLKTLN